MNNMKVKRIKEAIIGQDQTLISPYGKRLITYADYTASGKPLKFVEEYLLEIQKHYANSHTEDDLTGETMTKILHKSEKIILKEVNGLDNCSVFAAGTGSTGAIELFMKMIGVYVPPATKKRMLDTAEQGSVQSDLKNIFDAQLPESPVVFIGPYEHHSNITPWRESLAEVVQIDLDADGYLDIEDLKSKISNPKYANRQKIGSFSACSNVTGVKTDHYEVAKILHENDALACFDFAASGPYVEINMNKNEKSYFDAVYLSPHKFVGGPGSSGLLIINNDVYDMSLPPTFGGGGTVDYVSGFGQDYTKSIMEREKSGTPGIVQLFRAALAMELKGAIGVDYIEEKEQDYINRFFERFGDDERIEILGVNDPEKRLPILSFMVKYEDQYLHPRFITSLMNDLFGIQSRAGCSCAGPYGHQLLGIDNQLSDVMRGAIQNGINSLKPGWVRINLHYLMNDVEVDFILDAVDFILENAIYLLNDYRVDLKSGAWNHINSDGINEIAEDFGIWKSLEYSDEETERAEELCASKGYEEYLLEAQKYVAVLKEKSIEPAGGFGDADYEAIRWFPFY